MVNTLKKRKNSLRTRIEIFDWIVLGIFILLTIYFLFNYETLKNYLANDVQGYGILALFVIVFLLELLPQILSPDYPLMLAIAGGANIFSATLATMAASLIGSLLGFFIGHRYGFKFVDLVTNDKTLKKITSFWDKHGKIFVLASAVLPLPIPYYPVIFGALGMKLKSFVLWGVIPRIIGFIATALLAYYGVITLEKLF